ncbi:MAG: tRNA (adenosine(37)-N6)-threonylcarbamoyltransferase complex ATPase subunit type 1 TsaE [Defluviitaleaceae bacterium]|nr:tRNA (adenosine(37)-N6)-threonylcarbamoyltransferase complex ATPase subunit type 1 TsaE [Defluviitaleaceae bacterium]
MNFKSFSAEETTEIAVKFGQNANKGDIFCLSGALGVGKTIFVQGFAKGLGYTGRVTSPTFTLMNEYENARLPLYHFDLYRLKEESDLESIGCEEYFYGNGVCVIEWAERAEGFLPKNVYKVNITTSGDDSREIYIENTGD